MKKSRVLFFELAVIILLFPFSTDAAELETWPVGENGVHVAWDPASKPQYIPDDSEIQYCVYICEANSDGSESAEKNGALPVEKYVKNKKFKKEEPITDTSCTIMEFPGYGRFFIGVQTVVIGKNEVVVCDPKTKNTENRSDIAWSDKEIYTNYHPFDVRYGQK